ncbi:unnamed protein product [Penicillium pancosmium]
MAFVWFVMVKAFLPRLEGKISPHSCYMLQDSFAFPDDLVDKSILSILSTLQALLGAAGYFTDKIILFLSYIITNLAILATEALSFVPFIGVLLVLFYLWVQSGCTGPNLNRNKERLVSIFQPNRERETCSISHSPPELESSPCQRHRKLEYEARKADRKIRDIQKVCGERVQELSEMNTYLHREAAKSDAEKKKFKEGMRSAETRVEKLQSEMKILQVQNSQFAPENASLKNDMARPQEVCRSAGKFNPQTGPSKPKSLSEQLISQAETRQAEKRQWGVTKRKRADYSKRLKSEETKHWSRAKKLQSQNTQLVADKIELESQVSELQMMISNADTQARSPESLGMLQSEVADLKRQTTQVQDEKRQVVADKAGQESQVSNPQPMVLNADGGITQPARSPESLGMLQSIVTDLKRELDQVQAEKSRLVADKAQLQSKVFDHQTMVLNADGGTIQPARSPEEWEKLQSAVTMLKDENAKLRDSEIFKKQLLAERNAALQERTIAVQDRKSLEEQATEQVQKLEFEAKQLISAGDEILSELEALRSEHEDLVSAYKALHSDHEALKSRISTPNTNMGTRAMAESRESTISDKEKEVEELESTLSSQDQEIDKLKAEVTGLKSSQVETESQAGASDTQLRVELDECEEKIAALKEIERRDSETKALTREFDKKTEALYCELNKREEQNKGLELELEFKKAEMERELGFKDTEANNLASAVEMERQMFKYTGEELTRRSGEVERFRSLCDQLHRCVDAMDGQLGGLVEAAENRRNPSD